MFHFMVLRNNTITLAQKAGSRQTRYAEYEFKQCPTEVISAEIKNVLTRLRPVSAVLSSVSLFSEQTERHNVTSSWSSCKCTLLIMEECGRYAVITLQLSEVDKGAVRGVLVVRPINNFI